MKAKKTNNEKKSQNTNPFPHCGDFQKMAEMMKSCCPGEGDIIDCCSMMRRMTGQGKAVEAEETNETQK